MLSMTCCTGDFRWPDRLSRTSRGDRTPVDHSESPKTERKATDGHQPEITLAPPLHLIVQVGTPRVELLRVMSAAAHAIADPCRQHLAAGDALSWQFVGRRFLRLADTSSHDGLPLESQRSVTQPPRRRRLCPSRPARPRRPDRRAP